MAPEESPARFYFLEKAVGVVAIMPDILHRPTFEGSRQKLNHLLHSRASSPHSQADTISALKPIEEETLPKYNPDHFYPARLDEVLDDRYKIVAKLGYGMTATVWLARDLHV